MHVTTPKGRALAIAAGLAFTAGGLTILLGPELTHPLEWEAYQWLTILMVFGTIAAGHLMTDAARARHVFSALGFLALFLSGTGLVVYSSVGRQVEAADTTSLSAESVNDRIDRLKEERRKAVARRDYADQQAAFEIAGRPDKRGRPTAKPGCGGNCKDWQQNSRDVSAAIEGLDRQIAEIGPAKPVDAQASAIADIVALVGFDNRAQTIGILKLLVPFLKTLFFEIGSILSLGFAFRSVPRIVKSERFSDTAGQSDFPAASDAELADVRASLNSSANVIPLRPDNPPNGSPNGSGPKGGRRQPRKIDVLADIQSRIESGERFASQEDLRAALNGSGRHDFTIAKSTLSEWLGELGGSIVREQVGRRKVVG